MISNLLKGEFLGEAGNRIKCMDMACSSGLQEGCMKVTGRLILSLGLGCLRLKVEMNMPESSLMISEKVTVITNGRTTAALRDGGTRTSSTALVSTSALTQPQLSSASGRWASELSG